MKIVIFIMLATTCIHLGAMKRQKDASVASALVQEKIVQAEKKRALWAQQNPKSAVMFTELAAIITAPGALRAYVDPETAHIGTDTQNHD